MIQYKLSIIILISFLYLISVISSSTRKLSEYEKLTPYETGFEPFGDSRKRIDILFWLIA
jgi:NADH:ubiquinone oxidoreductase subunit 3 (subunit A)